MKIVKSIRIKYFRSILNTTRGNIVDLPTGDLNIIVGSNDAGKSNYLKALNLFFNNTSDPNFDFNFWKDFSHQRHGVRREENRIEIELVISPPGKQYFKNHGDVRWTKIWRDDSLLPEEHIKYVNGKNFTENNKSSYYKWLKKIRYKYVPAIKGERYFNDLMFNLYDVFQKDTKELEYEFNEQVRRKTLEISNQLMKRLRLESILQFHGSFRDLFNTLEFGSQDGKTMLSQRGDGIKVRHIPIILQNIAEAELMEDRKREPVASTIWGFEEPENNLEFASAKDLADAFMEYTDRIHFQNEDYSRYDEGIQIFLTTHSPIFYTLSHHDSPKIKSFYVSKAEDGSSNIRPISSEQSILIENEMKLLPLFKLSKHWKNINQDLEQLQKEKEEWEAVKGTLTNEHKCIFLTEDKNIGLVRKLLEANEFHLSEVDIRSYMGCTNIVSAEVLRKYLVDRFGKNCPSVVVHRDKDYLTDEEIEIETKKFAKLGVPLFITYGTDIESYFVRPTHVKICHPTIPENDILEIVSQAKKENREDAIQALRRKEFGQSNQDKSSHLKDAFPTFYDENEERLFHGKKVHSRVKILIRERSGENANIDKPTPELRDDNLERIRGQIWGIKKLEAPLAEVVTDTPQEV